MVDPEILSEFERLTVEIERDIIRLNEEKARLAEKKARHAELRAHLTRSSEAKEDMPKKRHDVEPPVKRVHYLDRVRDPSNYEEILKAPRVPPKTLIEVAIALRDLGGRGTNAQVAQRLMLSGQVVALRLSRAAKLGLIRRDRTGVYSLEAEKAKPKKPARS